MTDTLLTATTAKAYAARILTECSECYTNVKARKFLGKWVVDIDGGSGACYGKTLKSEDACEDCLRVFGNEPTVSEKRIAARVELQNKGFKRVSYTDDKGDGAYSETWQKGSETTVLTHTSL